MKLSIKLSVAALFITWTANAQTGAVCLSGNCSNGQGIYRFASGARFEGTFKNGQMLHGTLIFKDGDKYTGDFKDNLRHGKGTYYYAASHNVFTGAYANDHKVSGTFTYSDGGVYEGGFKNDKKEGRGKLVLKGVKYDGYWRADKFIGTQANGPLPTTYAVIVGVSRYAFSSANLQYPVSDAKKFATFLHSTSGGAVPEANITLLTDDQATRATIVATAKRIFAKAGKWDRIVFYYSGHGAPGSFVPYDAGSCPLITYDEIKAAFRGSNASSKLLVADACFAGAMRKGLDAVSDSLATSMKVAEKKLIEKAARENIIVMLSSSRSETSIESPELQQGVFTYYLMKGLSGEADKNADHSITIGELFTYTHDNTQAYARRKNHDQTPQCFGQFSMNTIIGTY